jgi:DNA-binding SARP family transcriptional activator
MVFATAFILAVDRGRLIERDAVAELLWPNEKPARRRHNLRQVLYKLRGAGAEFGGGTGPLMFSRNDVWLDFADFDHSITAIAPDLRAPGSMRFMPGFTPHFSTAFANWLDAVRERVESQVRSRLVEAIADCRRKGRWEHVGRLARECLQLDPLNDEANLALAESVALSGGKSKAVALLDAYLSDLGDSAADIRVPATILRRRITEAIGPDVKDNVTTSLIGREDIIGRLTRTVERAKSGVASAHMLWGPSGVGKTRVLEEMQVVAAIIGGTVLPLRASPEDRLTPGLSVVRLIRVLLEAPGALGLDPAVLKLLQNVATRQGGTDDFRSVGLSDDDLVRVLVVLARAIAYENIAVITFDDIHHADALSVRVLGLAFACLSVERLCLITASIPKPEMVGFGTAAIDRLDRLSQDAAAELTRRIAHAAGMAITYDEVGRVAVASGGNPFVVRETTLARSRNAGALDPPSILTILNQRILALSSGAKDLLFDTLALGEHASVHALLECSQLPHHSIENALAELEREQVLRVAADGRLDVHGLWHDIVDTLLPAGMSMARRHRIGSVLERLADQAPDAAELLLSSASQFERAGNSTRAATALARSGEEFRRRSLSTGAHAAFRRAAALSTGSTSFDKRLVQAIITGWQARQTTDVAALIDRFGDRLSRCESLSAEDHAELAVIQVELPTAILEYRTAADAINALGLGHPFTNLQKLRIAITGIQSAEFHYDRLSAATIGNLIANVTPRDYAEQSLAQQLAIVHALVMKDLPSACDVATQIVAPFTGGDIPFSECRLVLNARIPFWFDCNFERVSAILHRVSGTLDSYAGTVDALRFYDMQATHLIDTMRLDEADSMIANIERSILSGQVAGIRENLRELRGRLLLARGGSAIDESFEKTLSGVSMSRKCARDRTFALCNAAIALARGPATPTLRTVVDELSQHWKQIADMCPFDYPCVALAIGMKAIGRASTGRTLLQSYFKATRIARYAPSAFVSYLLHDFKLQP